jgi:tRNA nucleotidyltransferase (CCA-adding enzyme)
VRRADDLAKSTYLREKKLGELDEIAKIAEALKAENCCINLNGLAVSGEDMKLMGFKGKQIGVALNAALDGVIDEKIPNEKPQIEDYLRRVYIEKV